jgi:hypothetical protein
MLTIFLQNRTPAHRHPKQLKSFFLGARAGKGLSRTPSPDPMGVCRRFVAVKRVPTPGPESADDGIISTSSACDGVNDDALDTIDDAPWRGFPP